MKLETAGLSGIVQTFGMGSDALVAGWDVATANCAMVKCACADGAPSIPE